LFFEKYGSIRGEKRELVKRESGEYLLYAAKSTSDSIDILHFLNNVCRFSRNEYPRGNATSITRNKPRTHY
jgi:hypothetical protein